MHKKYFLLSMSYIPYSLKQLKFLLQISVCQPTVYSQPPLKSFSLDFDFVTAHLTGVVLQGLFSAKLPPAYSFFHSYRPSPLFLSPHTVNTIQNLKSFQTFKIFYFFCASTHTVGTGCIEIPTVFLAY